MKLLPPDHSDALRSEKHESFGDYAQLVDALGYQAVAPTVKTQRENFVVHCVTAGEQRLAIRIPYHTSAEWDHSSRLTALLRTLHIPRMEQLVTYDSSIPVIITEQAPGQSIPDIWRTEPELLWEIHNNQIRDIFSSISQAVDRGVMPDPSPENIFYDRYQGFTLIDSELEVPSIGSAINANYVCIELALYLLKICPNELQEEVNNHLRDMAKAALRSYGITETMVREEEWAMDERIYNYDRKLSFPFA